MKPKKYTVVPATGHRNTKKEGRWNVVIAKTREVIRGPFTEALAHLICDVMNEADSEALPASEQDARRRFKG